ncbi:hypothetical protein B0T25DRAFT_361946 [Lasiosphaeria hispida]|uniref:Uncharacterized protein n=1 Tax=Lasiosphaeria hispida TaxID=260671 RepID=A0AAJ0M7H9_9PEZI|nr:hypothetical protein B0T25DRAFT_361946 [Lasiosphaeria hispida]
MDTIPGNHNGIVGHKLSDTIFGSENDAVNHGLSGWQPEPSNRGTFGILSTCLITLGLCIWSAIHLNLPARTETPWVALCQLPEWLKVVELWPWNRFCWPGQFVRRVEWMLLGFFAPELVAFAAYQQYSSARSLTTGMKPQFSGDTTDPDMEALQPAIERQNEWTIVHSYFVVMGGYEVVAESKAHDFLPRTRAYNGLRKGLRLTPEGFRILAERFPHLIPDQPREKIEDKSKGDALAKAFVCIQSLWFCAQCFTRMYQQMGISLLELNTLGHTLCALLIYCVWWNKPLDILEPEQIWLREEAELQLVAAMCTTAKLDRRRSECERWMDVLHGTKKAMYSPPLGTMQKWGVEHYRKAIPYTLGSLSFPDASWGAERVTPHTDQTGVSQKSLFFPVISSGAGKRNRRWIMGLGNAVAYPTLPLAPGETGLLETEGHQSKSYLPGREGVFDTCLPQATTEKCPPGFRRLVVNISQFEECEGIFVEDIVRQHQVDRGRTRPTDTKTMTIDVSEGDFQRWKLVAQSLDQVREFAGRRITLLSDRLPNFPRLEAIRRYRWLYFGLTITGFAYGGLHCLAWNAPFSRDEQKQLWRMSSPTVASTGVLVLLLYSWELSPPYWRSDEGRFSAENWLGIGESMGRFKKSYWIADMIVPPFEWIVQLGKMVFDFLIVPGVLLFYCFARVYLVVECFISLEHLPASVYDVPKWSKYVPHIF